MSKTRRARAPSARLTVVVPTRERVDTLRECLRTVTAQDYEDLTIVVSDNCSQDSTAEYLHSLKDSRLHILNTGQRLSMAKNYEFALANLPHREGWVMLIGDDDGLVPGAARRAAEVLRETNAQALRSPACAYAWPSLTGKAYGRIGVPLGKGIERRDAKQWLRRVMQCKAAYQDLPMLYHGGVIPISIIDDIKRVTGTFYRSCIPDVYSAMAISSTIESYTWTDEPFAINGLSGHSIGMSQVRDAFKTGSPARRFQGENSIPFHPDIPLRDDGDYPMGQPAVYETFLQAAPLRTGPLLLTNHAEQLALTLATLTPELQASIGTWPERFARQHNLDLHAARVRAMALRPRLALRGATQFVDAALTIHAIGAPSMPLMNVFEASVAAGIVRSTLPGRTFNLPHVARRFLARLGASIQAWGERGVSAS